MSNLRIAGLLVLFLCGIFSVNVLAQQPIIPVKRANSANITVSTFLPEPRHMPYDVSSTTMDQDDAASRFSVFLSGQYYPLQDSATPGLFGFAGIEAFQVSDSHAENIQFGFGYLLSNGMFIRYTNNRYLIHGDLANGGEVIWNGLSIGLSQYPITLTKSITLKLSPEFYIFPPYNEYDPNPGIDFPDRITARYAIDTQILIEGPQDSHLSLIGRLFMPLGDSRPQKDYNWKTDLISIWWQLGIRYKIHKYWFSELGYSSEEDAGGLVETDRPRDYGYIKAGYAF